MILLISPWLILYGHNNIIAYGKMLLIYSNLLRCLHVSARLKWMSHPVLLSILPHGTIAFSPHIKYSVSKVTWHLGSEQLWGPPNGCSYH